MILKKIAAAAVTVGALLAAAAPAQAVVTTFAAFSAIGSGSSIRWQNSGANSTSGTGGTLYTISNQSATEAGARDVSFSFLQPSISPFVTNLTASFTLNASTVSGNPAALNGNFLVQTISSGNFSFVTKTDMVVGTKTFLAGSNLLSATFTNGTIAGLRNGSTGSFSGSTSDATSVAYTSDFLSFEDLSVLDFGLSLTSITSALQAIPTVGVPTRSLRTFRGVATGSFSADPAPIVTAIPEPAVWGMMIVGFAMVGLQTRRRGRVSAAVSA